jgi:predicted transcriptional regulator
MLEKKGFAMHTRAMSNKQIVEDLLQRIPEDASLHDIAREIEFIAAVRQGLGELDRGERIPIEEVERELPSWIIR